MANTWPAALCWMIASPRFTRARNSSRLAQRPRTPFSRAVDELVIESSPQFLVDHCRRSYALAVLLAQAQDNPVDEEVLFAGAMLHDLGLTARFHKTYGTAAHAVSRQAELRAAAGKGSPSTSRLECRDRNWPPVWNGAGSSTPSVTSSGGGRRCQEVPAVRRRYSRDGEPGAAHRQAWNAR
jgi:hypothetical protein